MKCFRTGTQDHGIARILLWVLVTFATCTAHAQYFRQSSYWKVHRKELDIGLGFSNFLGELGGRNQIGSPFVWDLELSQTKPAASFAFRYYVAEHFSLRTMLTYGVLAGNDNLTQEPFRHNRNLNFRTDLYEVAVLFEAHPYLEELGHAYDLRGVKGKKSTRTGLYAFAGVGVCYFDPKSKYNNSWVKLRPLSTEGQGLAGGPEPYNNYSICIPMGFGLRRAFSKTLSWGLELQYTKTFTDYIDDVSGVYYDNAALQETKGDVAAFLADPNLGLYPGQSGAGQQRGDSSDLDAYIFFKFQVHYKIYQYRTSSKHYRTRIRRQKIVF